MNRSNIQNKRSNKGKNFFGTVVSLSQGKTAKVEVAHTRIHPLYRKSLKRTRRFLCHNELPDLRVGDTVEIRQVRPISKTKYFSIVKKI